MTCTTVYDAVMHTASLKTFGVVRVVNGVPTTLIIRAVNGPAAAKIANEQVARKAAAQ